MVPHRGFISRYRRRGYGHDVASSRRPTSRGLRARCGPRARCRRRAGRLGAAADDERSSCRSRRRLRQRHDRRRAASSCSPTSASRPGGRTRPTRATSPSRTPTWRSRATTPSSAASTASTSTTSPTRRRRCTRRRSCARAARVTSRSTGTCCSCRSRRRARRRTARSTPAADATTRFRGVRIFDISNINAPTQVGGVQTCRGSHTHTLVEGKDSPDTVYIYVNGTSGTIRPATELAGCNAVHDPNAENPSQWRIEVIRVPLANPAQAAVVSEPRLMRNEQTGAVNGLQNAPQTPLHPSGIAWQPGAGLELLPRHHGVRGAEHRGRRVRGQRPADRHLRSRRTRSASTPWPTRCSPTGTARRSPTTAARSCSPTSGAAAPTARCRATDQLSWGANAIYEIVNSKLVFRSYYKIPPVQTDQENCVSHIPSIVPVPGRDIFVQAWYQGGMSVVDFTNPAAPKEIGFFDRGPISADRARPRRLLVGLLVQRRLLRLRDRPRLRRVPAHADQRPERGRVAQRGQRQAVWRASTPRPSSPSSGCAPTPTAA